MPVAHQFGEVINILKKEGNGGLVNTKLMHCPMGDADPTTMTNLQYFDTKPIPVTDTPG